MQRTPSSPAKQPGSSENFSARSTTAQKRFAEEQAGSFWDMLGMRVVFVAICVAAGFHFRPFSVTHNSARPSAFFSACRSSFSNFACAARACAA